MRSHKIKISPAQGLLLLIDYYKNDKSKVSQLKTFYLSGARSKKEADKIKNILKDPVLDKYEISYSMETINNDPTRRYFETHLAYEALRNDLASIEKQDLEKNFEALKNMLSADKLASVEHVLNGEFHEQDNELFKEYSDYIEKIRTGRMFDKLSLEEREKVELLAKCSFLGVVNAWYNPLPLNIYGTGIYSDYNKGKVMVADQATTRNQNFGLMKGHMPLALDDIALSDKEIPYLKPSDQAAFKENALWVDTNFKRLVHPFSNSISGTMLCQLRCQAQLRNNGKGSFTDSAKKLENYSKLLISTMLFGSGGHSLNEFTGPFSIKAVKEEFKSISGFDQISLNSMFSGDDKTLDAALDYAIGYNNSVLLRQNLQAQITGKTPVEPKTPFLAKVYLSHEFSHLKAHISGNMAAYNQKIKNQWFAFLRPGMKKNEIIQNGLKAATECLERGDLQQAQQVVMIIRKELMSRFGETNLWRQKSESLKLVEAVEHDLNYLHNKTAVFKEKLKENGVQEQLHIRIEAEHRLLRS